MKRGDEIYFVREWSHTEPVIMATRYRLTSLGKQQGTAVRVSDESNALVRFYADDITRNCCAVSDTESFASLVASAIESWRERQRGTIRCNEAAMTYVNPEHRQAVKDNIADCERRLSLTADAFEIRYE